MFPHWEAAYWLKDPQGTNLETTTVKLKQDSAANLVVWTLGLTQIFLLTWQQRCLLNHLPDPNTLLFMLLVLRNLSQHHRSDSRTIDPLSIAHYISAVVCFHGVPAQGRCLKLVSRLPQLILLTGSNMLGIWMVKRLLIQHFLMLNYYY